MGNAIGTATSSSKKWHLLVHIPYGAQDAISGDLPPCGPSPQASIPQYPGETYLRLLQHLLSGSRALRPLTVGRAADAWNGLSSALLFASNSELPTSRQPPRKRLRGPMPTIPSARSQDGGQGRNRNSPGPTHPSMRRPFGTAHQQIAALPFSKKGHSGPP